MWITFPSKKIIYLLKENTYKKENIISDYLQQKKNQEIILFIFIF